MYTNPLSTLMSSSSLSHHLYADDSQLFLSRCSGSSSDTGIDVHDMLSMQSSSVNYTQLPKQIPPSPLPLFTPSSTSVTLRCTCSSSLVTLARPSTSLSLRITDRSFQYASPRLWNQLPTSLRQPRTNLSNSASPSSFEWHFLHQFHQLTTPIIHYPFTLSLHA